MTSSSAIVVSEKPSVSKEKYTEKKLEKEKDEDGEEDEDDDNENDDEDDEEEEDEDEEENKETGDQIVSHNVEVPSLPTHIESSPSPSPSHVVSPVMTTSNVRSDSRTGFVLAGNPVLSPSSPLLPSLDSSPSSSSLSSSSSFSSPSPPPEPPSMVSQESNTEAEHSEGSKDAQPSFLGVHGSSMDLYPPEKFLSSNESDSDESDFSDRSTEYLTPGGLGKGKDREESKHIQEYPDVHKGAQGYTDQSIRQGVLSPTLVRKESASPSSDSSAESGVGRTLRVSISRFKINAAAKFSLQSPPKTPSPPPSSPPPPPVTPNPMIYLSSSKIDDKPNDTSSTGLQVSSSASKKVRSILPPSPRPSLAVSMTPISKATMPKFEPLTPLMVTILRRSLSSGRCALTPSPISEEGVKVTIPKAMLRGEIGVKKPNSGSRKRKWESTDSELKLKDPKKVN